MGMEVPSRVHIMPLGYEKERVIKPAKALKADTVILVPHETDANDAEHLTSVLDALSDEGYRLEEDEIQIYPCNIFDMYDSLGKIAELISQNINDEVYVNVSTGSKVTAIAGMIACMVTHATPYYARATNYQEDTPSNIQSISELPQYQINPPERQQVEILKYLKENENKDVSKGDLIQFGEKQQLPFITQHDVQKKGQYRVLDRNIINPLLEDRYIEIEKVGRSKIVRLTDQGRNAVQAFQYLIQ